MSRRADGVRTLRRLAKPRPRGTLFGRLRVRISDASSACQACGAGLWELWVADRIRQVWVGVVDHVIPERYWRATARGTPHQLENLIPVCPSCHGRKTAQEYRLYRADVVGYKAELTRIGYPAEAVEAAFRAWGRA